MSTHLESRFARVASTSGRLLAVGLLAAASVALAACKPADEGSAAAGDTAPATTTAPPRVQATPTGIDTSRIDANARGPVLTFEKTNHDFGAITDTQTYETSFPFTNTGSSELRIQQVKASCGCTVPTLPKFNFAPGESGDIAVVFDPNGKKGDGIKKVTVLSNATNGNPIEVTFSHSIAPMVTPETKFLRMTEAQLHRESKASISFWYTDPNLVVEGVSINNPALSAEIIEQNVLDSGDAGTDGAVYRFTVEVTLHADAPWGTLYSTRLTTRVHGRPLEGRDPIVHEYTTFIQGTIFGELVSTTASRGRRATPSSVIALGAQLAPGQEYAGSVTLTRKNRSGFTVVSADIVESTMPGVQVSVVPVDSGGYEITISGNTGTFRGDIRGTAEIMTDVPNEGPVTIRFSGRVA